MLIGRISDDTRLHLGFGLLNTGYEETGNSRTVGVVVAARDVLRVSISNESWNFVPKQKKKDDKFHRYIWQINNVYFHKTWVLFSRNFRIIKRHLNKTIFKGLNSIYQISFVVGFHDCRLHWYTFIVLFSKWKNVSPSWYIRIPCDLFHLHKCSQTVFIKSKITKLKITCITVKFCSSYNEMKGRNKAHKGFHVIRFGKKRQWRVWLQGILHLNHFSSVTNDYARYTCVYI